jgi:hypothetical protein
VDKEEGCFGYIPEDKKSRQERRKQAMRNMKQLEMKRFGEEGSMSTLEELEEVIEEEESGEAQELDSTSLSALSSSEALTASPSSSLTSPLPDPPPPSSQWNLRNRNSLRSPPFGDETYSFSLCERSRTTPQTETREADTEREREKEPSRGSGEGEDGGAKQSHVGEGENEGQEYDDAEDDEEGEENEQEHEDKPAGCKQRDDPSLGGSIDEGTRGKVNVVALESLIQRLRKRLWKSEAEGRLREIVELRMAVESDEEWDVLKHNIDRFWCSRSAYSGSSMLSEDRYSYWRDLSLNDDPLMGTIGATLMSAASTEASCERGFSILRKIFSKQRQMLSVSRLNDLVTIRESV